MKDNMLSEKAVAAILRKRATHVLNTTMKIMNETAGAALLRPADEATPGEIAALIAGLIAGASAVAAVAMPALRERPDGAWATTLAAEVKHIAEAAGFTLSVDMGRFAWLLGVLRGSAASPDAGAEQPEAAPEPEHKPSVVRAGPLDTQVCVPADWTDEMVEAFANAARPCGTSGGWRIRRQGDPLLDGCDERVPCLDDEEYVHIMLDC